MNIDKDNIFNIVSKYEKILIAYSGGVDSHTLLHLISSMNINNKISAIHINHGINIYANSWENHCYTICKELKINFLSFNIPKIIPESCNLEEILRKYRYKIFADILQNKSCLLTAHNADDQVETLLLQLFRGSGPKGLSAMPIKMPFSNGYIIRPLLNVQRHLIEQYALKNNLQWIEDNSNIDTRFNRNFIRHKLLPIIRQRWPSITKTIYRTIQHCAEATSLLDVLGQEDLLSIKHDKDNIINIEDLKKLSLARQKNLLRSFFIKLKLPLPSEIKLQELFRSVINSRYDANPVVKWKEVEVRRFRHKLYIIDTSSFFTININKNEIAKKLNIDVNSIAIKFRQGGEKIKIDGRQGTHDLKKIMQEWNIPPWLRDKIPLIFYKNIIVAIIGYYPKQFKK